MGSLRVRYIEPVYSLNGSIAHQALKDLQNGDHQVQYKTYNATGKNFIAHLPRNQAYLNRVENPTPEQLQKQQTFSIAAAATAVALADPEQVANYKTAFRKQSKYKTLRGFVFAQKYAMNQP